MTVESMFSHGYLYRFHGTNEFADMAERAAFNALPGAVTADCEFGSVSDARMYGLTAFRVGTQLHYPD